MHYAEIRSDTLAASRLSQNLDAWDLFFNLWCFMHLDRRMFHRLFILMHMKKKNKKLSHGF